MHRNLDTVYFQKSYEIYCLTGAFQRIIKNFMRYTQPEQADRSATEIPVCRGAKKEFKKWRFWELDLPWRRIFTKED